MNTIKKKGYSITHRNFPIRNIQSIVNHLKRTIIRGGVDDFSSIDEFSIKYSRVDGFCRVVITDFCGFLSQDLKRIYPGIKIISFKKFRPCTSIRIKKNGSQYLR